MEINFGLRGVDGRVVVGLERNEDPELVGGAPGSRGFPICEATVEYPARGYDAVLGWIQLVRSDENTSGGQQFEIDPLEFLGDLPHPFCWFGIRPTLFDAPSRSLDRDMDWMARSFLCVPDHSDGHGLEVHALLGFSWGFRIENEQILLVAPSPLRPTEWNEHVAVLADHYPSWHFLSDFRGR